MYSCFVGTQKHGVYRKIMSYVSDLGGKVFLVFEIRFLKIFQI